HAWSRHGRVVRSQEDELLVGVHAHHQPPPVLREHVVLHPPENVPVELRDRGPSLRVESVGGHGHGDVVEAGLAGLGGTHDAAPGATRTFAAIWPPARPCMASSVPASGTSTGSMSSWTGKRPDD